MIAHRAYSRVGHQVLYLSGMYTRGEMALRIGIFYTSASLSGAFGGMSDSGNQFLELYRLTLVFTGLLARGLTAIGTAGGLTGWRWIFIIEGLFVSSSCFCHEIISINESISHRLLLSAHLHT